MRLPGRLRRSTIGANLGFALLAPFRLVRGNGSRLNVFLTHPPLFHVLGGTLSRRRGVPYIVHLMDLYPDILRQAGWLSAGNPAVV